MSLRQGNEILPFCSVYLFSVSHDDVIRFQQGKQQVMLRLFDINCKWNIKRKNV